MRALHLNPWTRTITEIDLDDDGEGCVAYASLRAAVFHGSSHPGYIEHVSLGGNVSAWIDEEGMLVPWDEQRFLALHPAGKPQQGQSYAGHMILTGDDGWGNSVALADHITPTLVRQTVQWLDAREVTVEAPKFYTENEETGELTLEHDQGTWTYENQPR